eukprot:XP_014052806.1 PREDICTED: uncharacterized protein LOC106603523 isoform X2 [Salmo salar]
MINRTALLMWGICAECSVQWLTGIACTDEQRQWNVGTWRNLEPMRLNSIDFTHHKASDQYAEKHPECPSLHPTTAFHAQEELNRSLRHLNLPMGSLLCVNTEPTNNITASSTQPHGEHINYNCQKCLSFYNEIVKLDPTQSTVLEQIPKEQSASHLWHDLRKLRGTASSATKVPVRESTNPGKFFQEHLYPRFHGNVATRYRKDNELMASQWLEDLILCGPQSHCCQC